MDTIEEALEALRDMDLSDVSSFSPDEWKPIAIWVPIDYKMKYDRIQARTKRRFCKILKDIAMQAIDKVDVSKG
ncbi:MAG: hypothetical protein AB7G93_09575 [Bdellovibrionales bacterium]